MDMDMMKYLPEQLGILVVALGIIGAILKKTPKVQDWTIPWIELVLGVIGSIALQTSFSALAFVQGIVAAGITSLGAQLYIQTMRSRKDDKVEEPKEEKAA